MLMKTKGLRGDRRKGEETQENKVGLSMSIRNHQVYIHVNPNMENIITTRTS